jgi:hypothetical protein
MTVEHQYCAGICLYMLVSTLVQTLVSWLRVLVCTSTVGMGMYEVPYLKWQLC